MELSLRRLRMLRELHLRGTVTAVAAALHYSPSGVSQQLAQLERDVGARLVERHGRRLLLTDLGLVLAEHAEQILGSVDRATMALEQAQNGVMARLTAGVWASVASSLVPQALSSLAVRYPGIEVRTVELDPEQTAGAVKDGTLDFSFVIDYSVTPVTWDPQLTRTVIAVERLHAAVPTGMIPSETVRLAQLADYPWILARESDHFGHAVRIACHQKGFDPRIVHTVAEQPTALAMAAGGLGVTLVSDLALELIPDGVDIIALEEPVMRTVSIAYRATPTRRPSLELVIDAIRTAAAEKGLAIGSAPAASVSAPASNPLQNPSS
ncbi:LysR family transcriptional regulator [Citricoccus sp.]|uniref:LysR family transcriptional regulator n=1 Tax=Citricoccus sp. TaxID=1978372 RepID=UPI0028BD85B6|nr:LysR family transcriptional regulator [Citricoccus sp.]